MSARAPPPQIMDLIKPRIPPSLKPTEAKSSQPTPSKKNPRCIVSFPFPFRPPGCLLIDQFSCMRVNMLAPFSKSKWMPPGREVAWM